MTKREAAIVAAYTGVTIGKFSDMLDYIMEKLGRRVWDAELGRPETRVEVERATLSDFQALEVTDD